MSIVAKKFIRPLNHLIIDSLRLILSVEAALRPRGVRDTAGQAADVGAAVEDLLARGDVLDTTAAQANALHRPDTLLI